MNWLPIGSASKEESDTDTFASVEFGLEPLRFPSLPDDQNPIVSLFADHDLYQDLIEHFVAGLHQDIRAIDDAIHDDNPLRISHLAHKIRGTAATFGYPTFAAVSETIESTIQNLSSSSLSAHDVQLLRTLVSQMQSLHMRMLAALPKR